MKRILVVGCTLLAIGRPAVLTAQTGRMPNSAWAVRSPALESFRAKLQLRADSMRASRANEAIEGQEALALRSTTSLALSRALRESAGAMKECPMPVAKDDASKRAALKVERADPARSVPIPIAPPGCVNTLAAK